MANSSPAADHALSPSIVRARKVCQEKGLTKYRWSAKSFPELHPKLDGHLLAQTSRCGRERFLQPEEAVGSKAWFAKTGKKQIGRKWLETYQEFTGHMSDSWNLHPLSQRVPVRDSFIHGSPQGCIFGEATQLDPPLLGHQPKGYATWVQGGGQRWTPDKHNVPRVVPAREFNAIKTASLKAISEGKDPAKARKSATEKLLRTNPRSRADSLAYSQSKKTLNDATLKLGMSSATRLPDSHMSSTMGSTGGATLKGSMRAGKFGPNDEDFHPDETQLSMSRSMPTLAKGPYPPSPAYVRSFMRQIDLEKPDY